MLQQQPDVLIAICEYRGDHIPALLTAQLSTWANIPAIAVINADVNHIAGQELGQLNEAKFREVQPQLTTIVNIADIAQQVEKLRGGKS